MPNEIHLRNQALAFYKDAFQATKRLLDRELAAIRDNPLPDGDRIIPLSPGEEAPTQYIYARGPWLITFGVRTDRRDIRFNVIVTGIIHNP